MYYDREGNEISLEEWASKFGDKSYQTLARTLIDEGLNGVTVSTVWLGYNHGFPGGRRLIFETMIFGGEHDQDMRRYSTEEEAMEGHAEMVALVTGEPKCHQ